MVRANVSLIDASGSMRLAWYEVWKIIFENIYKYDVFSILAFKHPPAVKDSEKVGIVYQNKYVAIIDVAKLLALRYGNVVKIRRQPEPEHIGLQFNGYTPLLAALVHVARIVRKRYPYADITVILPSDNRDSLYARDPEYRAQYNENSVIEAKRTYNVKLVLYPVGNPLLKFVRKYDIVYGRDTAERMIDVLL